MKSSNGRLIDLARWARRPHLELFKTYQQPFFSVTIEVDVTQTWTRCKRPGGPPFFLASLFLMLQAANAIEALRRRLRPRGVWVHDRVGVAPTIAREDGTFGFVRLESCTRLDRFVVQGRAAIANASAAHPPVRKSSADDVIYHSVLPWLRFTSFTNALPGTDSIPRIVFGRCTNHRRRIMMPVAVEVHHALVDGFDVAQFFDRFTEGLARPGVS